MPNSNMTGHVDAYLSNVSINYIQSQEMFIADKVFPIVPVQKAADIFLTYPRGYFFRDQVKERPLGGESPRMDFKTGKDSYFCIEEGLSSDLDDRERANAVAPYDPEKSRILALTQQHLIHRDRRWSDAYFKSGIWTTELQGVNTTPGANQFLQFDNADSDPVDTIDSYRDHVLELTGFEPNVMVCGRKAFRKLKNHPAILDLIKYSGKGIITADLLAQIFNVQKFLVPGGIHNTAAETEADNGGEAFEFIVPKSDILLCYAAPNAALDQPSAGYTFSWRGLLGNQAWEAVVNRGRAERAHSDWFEVRMAFDIKKVAGDLGVFFKDVVE
ncbi:major capsid protein [Petroclostridium sp. X23]|uniref:major capsid protein n=1 Tax=Petroclostridium sp. X23 TaxID=3045146 RepID=UPI0024ACBBFB|nr:major capsid protein [Petroclostridium sp. X23]WHH58303.1 major capsid protein [Petroclostridium sp. X23]